MKADALKVSTRQIRTVANRTTPQGRAKQIRIRQAGPRKVTIPEANRPEKHRKLVRNRSVDTIRDY